MSDLVSVLARDLPVLEHVERMREAALAAQLAIRAGRCLEAVASARFALEECLRAVGAAHGGDRADLPGRCEAYGVPGPGGAPWDPAGSERYVNAAVGACETLSRDDLEVEILLREMTWTLAPGVGDLRLSCADRDDRDGGAYGGHLAAPELGARWPLTPEQAEAWRRLSAGGTTRWPGAEVDLAGTDLLTLLYVEGVVTLAGNRGPGR